MMNRRFLRLSAAALTTLMLLSGSAFASPDAPGDTGDSVQSAPTVTTASLGGSSWPTAQGERMTGHQPGASGPAQPQLDWIATGEELGGWFMDGTNAGTRGAFDDIVLAPSGDLLVLAARMRDTDGNGELEREGGLLALDRDDGTLRWSVTPINDQCKPAVGADGLVWAFQVLDGDTREPGDHPDATRALVAIDPADGSIVDGKRYTGETVPLSPTGDGGCGSNGIQVAADGTLLIRDSYSFDPHARAIDPADGTARWEQTFDRSCSPSDWFWTPPAGAPNADRVYLSVDGDETDCPQASFSLVAHDLATGAAVDEVALSGPGIGSRRSQATADDGRLLVNSDDYRPVDDRLSHLLWISDDSGLAVDAEVEINDSLDLDDPACADSPCRRIHSVSLAGDRIVGWSQGGIVSIDATDLSLEWRASGSSTSSDAPTDTDGVVYVTNLSGSGGVKVRSIDADGGEIGSVEAEGEFSTVRTLGPVGDDGRLYGRSGDAWFALSTSGDAADRVSGLDRYETAVELSRATFDPGVPAAFIATGENFPDALSGGVPAALENAPMLLVRTGSIPNVTVDELRRLAPQRIVVLGGPAAVDESVEGALSAYTDGEVERWFGADRYATAAQVSVEAFPDAGAVDEVYVASGENFPDALSGVPAAATATSPILLVQPDEIPSATLGELGRLDPDEVVVLGGTAAVSADVEEHLEFFGDVERLEGGNRYETSATISGHAFPGGADTVFVATGGVFADALSAGAVAGAVPGPVLLTQSGSLPQVQAAEVTRLDPDRVVILGGTNAVSSAVETELGALVGE